MKALIASLLVMSSSAGFANQICTDVPEGMKFDDIKVNFDGSKTYYNPQVHVEGDYALVSGSETSAKGLCNALDLTYVSARTTIYPMGPVAILDKDGSLLALSSSERSYLSRLLCAEPKL